MGSVLDRIIYLLQKEECGVHNGVGLLGISWIRPLESKLSPFQDNFQNYLAACPGKLAKLLVLGKRPWVFEGLFSPSRAIEYRSTGAKHTHVMSLGVFQTEDKLLQRTCFKWYLYVHLVALKQRSPMGKQVCLFQAYALLISYAPWQLGREVTRA